jgi:hypothetical protein
LYLATLPELFVRSRSFLVESLGSFKYRIISSGNGHNLTSSLSIWIPFNSLSGLIAVAKNSNIILNKTWESGHPYLTLEFRGNDFSFSSFSMMLALGLLYVALLVLRYILQFLVASELLSWKAVEFCPTLSLHQLRLLCVFCSFAYMFDYIMDLCMLNILTLHSWNQSTWLWCVTFLMWCWI